MPFFCVYGDHDIQGRWQISVNQKERIKITKDRSFLDLCELKVDYTTYMRCYKEVWDEHLIKKLVNARKLTLSTEEDQRLRSELWKLIVETRRESNNTRGNSCFYRQYREGMSLQAAAELEAREYTQAETSADRKWVKCGVWVAVAIGVLASVMSKL